jgi:hypothetical protein
VATWSPYILIPLIEKTPMTELTVYIVRDRTYKRLNEAEIAEILDLGCDIFFNLDRFWEL